MFLYSLEIRTTNVLDLRPFKPKPIKSSNNKDWRTGKVSMISILCSNFKEISSPPTTGSLHLYRDLTQNLNHEISDTGRIVCVLAVPLYMTPQDFLKLMGAQRNDLVHVRIFKDSIPNRFMLLLKFKTKESSLRFHKDFNGKPFNSFEPETCNVVFISSIFVNSSENVFPNENLVPSSNSKGVKGDSSSGNIVVELAKDKLVELPTCPVCLERMDSTVTGIYTTLCQHTFHCHCIMRWGDTTCPVCRYSTAKIADSENAENTCSICQSGDNLWICLICANVGCGRYVQAHASEHFKQTNHMYSLELETQRVWDYKGDEYVHRLIQNNDGKLVQLPPPSDSAARFGLDMYDPNSLVSPQDLRVAEKIEHIIGQFQAMSQSREQQQNYMFDEQLTKTELSSIDTFNKLEGRIVELETVNTRLRHERDAIMQLLDESSVRQEKDKEKMAKLVMRLVATEKRLVEESTLNESLRANQAALQDQLQKQAEDLQSQEAEISDLRDQVKDLMFFLENRQKAENGEILSISMKPVQTPSPKKGKKKK